MTSCLPRNGLWFRCIVSDLADHFFARRLDWGKTPKKMWGSKPIIIWSNIKWFSVFCIGGKLLTCSRFTAPVGILPRLQWPFTPPNYWVKRPVFVFLTFMTYEYNLILFLGRYDSVNLKRYKYFGPGWDLKLIWEVLFRCALRDALALPL